MDSWVYCKECKTKDDCVYSVCKNPMRVHVDNLLETSEEKDSIFCHAFYATTPKSDMEVIVESIEKIEKRICYIEEKVEIIRKNL